MARAALCARWLSPLLSGLGEFERGKGTSIYSYESYNAKKKEFWKMRITLCILIKTIMNFLNYYWKTCRQELLNCSNLNGVADLGHFILFMQLFICIQHYNMSWQQCKPQMNKYWKAYVGEILVNTLHFEDDKTFLSWIPMGWP